MKIPISYSYRNLWTRKLTTILTLCGIALVVFVFAAVLMLAYGLKKTLVSTGSPDNVVVIRKAANSDLLSAVGRESASLVETLPDIARDSENKPLLSKESVLIINLLKYGSHDMGNVIIRGVSPAVLKLRPQVKIIQGKMLREGTTEVIVGKSIAKRFQGANLGDVLKFGSHEWTVVGIFDAQKSGFESEIWTDSEQMMSAFNRPVFSTITLRLQDPKNFQAFKTRFESEARLQELEVKNEQKYYAEQSETLGLFIKVLGIFITVLFSIGAMVGAMITMYAAVSNRVGEIGTMRALGFQRRSILTAFLIESIFLAILGGCVGLIIASFLQTVTISTINFDTFSELAFGFNLNPWIVVWSLLFAVVMGIVGGFLPAVRASRLNIVNALRES
ncbi:MAG TPA: ABC transporter permease [Acidobacteriota bacterium]|nr:ABC transporter permease [Acidobacteriota bacterium]